jgi:DNA-damage-inducible protein D
MADEELIPHTSPFDATRKVDEQGQEYWSARDLQRLLGYKNWREFEDAIKRAMIACKNSGQKPEDHFGDVPKMVSLGSGSQRKVKDYHLSRYACYLIVQNAASEKPIVALGQTYFAVQTRRQELADQMASLPEDQKRLILRSEMTVFNQQLAEAAYNAGVMQPQDFAIFQDHGYMGLYGGLRENDIHAHKQLDQKEKILDYMGSEELASNIFRAAQTDAKLRREEIQGKEQANQTHHEVGNEVRQVIKRLGGTMPEDLPTPEKSIQQLQRDEQKRIKQQAQPSLFDTSDEL